MFGFVIGSVCWKWNILPKGPLFNGARDKKGKHLLKKKSKKTSDLGGTSLFTPNMAFLALIDFICLKGLEQRNKPGRNESD